MAKHSFRTALLMQFNARRRIAKHKPPSIERSFYSFNIRTISIFFSKTERRVLMALAFY